MRVWTSRTFSRREPMDGLCKPCVKGYTRAVSQALYLVRRDLPSLSVAGPALTRVCDLGPAQQAERSDEALGEFGYRAAHAGGEIVGVARHSARGQDQQAFYRVGDVGEVA